MVGQEDDGGWKGKEEVRENEDGKHERGREVRARRMGSHGRWVAGRAGGGRRRAGKGGRKMMEGKVEAGR